MTDDDKKKNKTGPKEDRLHLEMDWEESTKKAIKKKRPKEGWPETENNKKNNKKNDK